MEKLCLGFGIILEKGVERSNRARRPPLVYQPKEWMWALRNKTGESDQMIETWLTGPVEVKKRVGDANYEAEWHSWVLHAFHADMIKKVCPMGKNGVVPFRGL